MGRMKHGKPQPHANKKKVVPRKDEETKSSSFQGACNDEVSIFILYRRYCRGKVTNCCNRAPPDSPKQRKNRIEYDIVSPH